MLKFSYNEKYPKKNFSPVVENGIKNIRMN